MRKIQPQQNAHQKSSSVPGFADLYAKFGASSLGFRQSRAVCCSRVSYLLASRESFSGQERTSSPIASVRAQSCHQKKDNCKCLLMCGCVDGEANRPCAPLSLTSTQELRRAREVWGCGRWGQRCWAALVKSGKACEAPVYQLDRLSGFHVISQAFRTLALRRRIRASPTSVGAQNRPAPFKVTMSRSSSWESEVSLMPHAMRIEGSSDLMPLLGNTDTQLCNRGLCARPCPGSA